MSRIDVDPGGWLPTDGDELRGGRVVDPFGAAVGMAPAVDAASLDDLALNAGANRNPDAAERWVVSGLDIPARAIEADPYGKNPHERGAKLDAGKPLPWLVLSGFSRALAAVVQVGTDGAVEYTPDGWLAVPDGTTRYRNAELRHFLLECNEGPIDAKSGSRHLAHRCWNLLAVLELTLRAEAGDGGE